METKREKFGSRFAVIMAMAGSAIGLGNIWRFPYMVGEHGGGAFVLVYILATILISLPIFVAEVVIGRRSGRSAAGAMSTLAGGRIWKFAGFLPVFIPLFILSYYSVVGGWSLEFLIKSCRMAFSGVDPESVTGMFGDFIVRPWAPVVSHLVFLAVCGAVIALGVRSGIEKFSKYSIPVLFVLIVVILCYSLSLPGAGEGVRYLMKFDVSALNPQTFAYAMGQSFYSLSLGMGTIITYGSYVSRKENILMSGVGTGVSDLMFAILACFAIMPAVFAAGIAPGAGPGLIFQSLPFVFAKMGAEIPAISAIVSIIFFLTIVVAAMTSSMSLYEVGVAYLVENTRIKRGAATALIFVGCGVLGVFSAMSFGPLSGVQLAGKGIFDLFDWLSSNILLIFASLLTVIFVGWVMKKNDVKAEFTNNGSLSLSGRLFGIVYFLIKYLAPVALAIIFVANFIL